MPPVVSRRMLGVLAVAILLPAGAADARSGPGIFAPLVKQVLPGVVNIAVPETVAAGADPLSQLPPELRKQFQDRLKGRREQVHGAGSGFIIDPSGIIVTNNHVVGSADTIVVSLSDGTELKATLIGSDDLTDVAVIKVNPAAPLPAATWGDSKAVQPRDW